MKRFRKKMVAAILMSAMILSGCGETLTSDGDEVQDDSTLEIGMCFDSFVIERWQKDRDVFVDKASSLGATVNVQNANGDVNKQIEQIQYFIDKNVDCLVIIPIDGGAITDVVNKAKQKGIPVVCYDRLIRDVNADLYISFDNEMVGEMLGQALADQGAKKVIMICGPLTDNNVPMVEKGFRRVMEDSGNDIIDVFYADGWKAEEAAKALKGRTEQELRNNWGLPDGMLSGFYGDIYEYNGKTIVIYYDADSSVTDVLISDARN